MDGDLGNRLEDPGAWHGAGLCVLPVAGADVGKAVSGRWAGDHNLDRPLGHLVDERLQRGDPGVQHARQHGCRLGARQVETADQHDVTGPQLRKHPFDQCLPRTGRVCLWRWKNLTNGFDKMKPDATLLVELDQKPLEMPGMGISQRPDRRRIAARLGRES